MGSAMKTRKSGWKVLLAGTLLLIGMAACVEDVKEHAPSSVRSSSSKSKLQQQEGPVLVMSKDQSIPIADGATPSNSNGTARKERSIIISSSGYSGGYVNLPRDHGLALQSNGLMARDYRDVEQVLDRNKSAIYALYVRALHDNMDLSGRVVLQLTVSKSGHVANCRILSSSMGDADFERKLIARISQIDFGAGEYKTITIIKPFDFIPRKLQDK